MAASNSAIRSEGAELLVQAILMLEYGVITSRASRNMPGYDIIAHNLKNRTDCRLSVKYRKAANCDGFRFTRIDDFDFFVGIIGHRGTVGAKSTAQDALADMLSQTFILSRDEVQASVRVKGKKSFVPRKCVQVDERKAAWKKILDFLKVCDPMPQPSGPANGSQPSRRDRSRASAAAGSRR
ncbi:MAG: hypothetical protein HS113_20090 [Verrucomicrobiales bacterium]|nr:hypothetical protein [Verrucomicrobiales bacterium]